LSVHIDGRPNLQRCSVTNYCTQNTTNSPHLTTGCSTKVFHKVVCHFLIHCLKFRRKISHIYNLFTLHKTDKRHLIFSYKVMSFFVRHKQFITAVKNLTQPQIKCMSEGWRWTLSVLRVISKQLIMLFE